jgi:cobalamin biosynthesis protein CbiG
MRNLLLILISAALIPINSNAASLDDCKKIVDSAQKVIDKQDELINVMKNRNEDLFKEKTALERSLDDSRQATETAREHEILWGVIGIAAGALATAYIASRTH